MKSLYWQLQDTRAIERSAPAARRAPLATEVYRSRKLQSSSRGAAVAEDIFELRRRRIAERTAGC